ncbi:MAG: 4-alpha-glucanotransferase [Anaerolineae bacterium]|nr:4-alpha-glucanotransferase [Anaerolineae bacterium]
MALIRSSGILLHPTSLPGPDGIGDLGPEAYRWIDFIAQADCSLWQVLPLGPTGYGDSPYQCFSAFAGNPNLISPALLIEDGLLTLKDLEDRPIFNDEKIDFGRTIEWKKTILARAYRHFKNSTNSLLISSFQAFSAQQSFWLDDYSLFMAIKESQGGVSWSNWPEALRMHDEDQLKKFLKSNFEYIESQKFYQFLFFKQWSALHQYANGHDIKIVGDIPIFVSFDSSDTWANPDLFYLDEERRPTVVAGVPPDYFSPTGQLWGNPLYRWDAHAKTHYKWWISRIKSTLEQVDIVRLDHFRGFAGYWEVQADKPTAEEGKWVKGPGEIFFDVIKNELGDLPIIAEDLGEITRDVVALREKYNLPGMKIMQFGFDTPINPFLPHNYPVNCVAYTGSHDNDTVRGWYETAPDVEKDLCRRYLACSGENISWDMIRSVWGSVAAYAIAPMQDFLSLGNAARMNYPGKLGGNWEWRMPASAINAGLIAGIRELNFLFSRQAHATEKLKEKLDLY